MEYPNQKVGDWLESRAESQKTKSQYMWSWNIFKEFCVQRGKNPNNIVDDYRAVKYAGEMKREEFLEQWQDIMRAFTPWLNNVETPQHRKRFAPLSVKDHLATIKSFMGYWKIPIDVDLPKHACVIYHNRDLKREEFKQILTFATARDRVIYILLGESGMRVDTAVNLKYWQIKEDFEAKRIPMRILLPSSTLKDHVGDRWTFIGEDGFNALSDYLAKRTLKDDDYIFKSEKQGLVAREQFTTASISVKFNRIIQKLNIAPSLGQPGKPKKIRLHGLRKYFRNNMKADSSYINFWLGHTLGVDAHYISRDPEEHRKRYAEGYKELRIFAPSKESLTNLYEMVNEKDKELRNVTEELVKLRDSLKAMKQDFDLVKKVAQPILDFMYTEDQRPEKELTITYKKEPVPREYLEKLALQNPEYQKLTDEERKNYFWPPLHYLKTEIKPQNQTSKDEKKGESSR